MIPAPGSVRGLFFCPSGCLIGCSCRQRAGTAQPLTIARDHRPRPSCAVLGALMGTPAPLTISLLCAVRLAKALWRVFMSEWVLTAPLLRKRVTRRLHAYQRHSGVPFVNRHPFYRPILPRSAQTQPQNAAEPPEPQRIFAQDSSGFSLCFCSGFRRFFTVISVRSYSQP